VARCLMGDEEWAVFEPFLTGCRSLGGRPPRDHRRTLDGVFRMAVDAVLIVEPRHAAPIG